MTKVMMEIDTKKDMIWDRNFFYVFQIFMVLWGIGLGWVFFR